MRSALRTRLMAAALVAGTNFSLCTGGLLSATAALASNFPPEHMQNEPLMSRAVPEDFVCMSMSPFYADEAERQPAKEGCEDGAECLDQAHHSITQHALFTLALSQGDLPEAAVNLVMTAGPAIIRKPVLASLGPPLFNARNHANILVKRE